VNIEPKTIKIIKSMYWKNGWIDPSDRTLADTDRDRLAEGGWDLGSIEMSHDQLVGEVIKMSQAVSLEACVSLLSGSLPTRAIQDRSFLSSVVQAMTVPDHKYSGDGRCPVCGLHSTSTLDQGVLLFEKIMWGGVRLTDMSYVWLDLTLLGKDEELQPSGTADLRVLLDELAVSEQGLSAYKFCASLKAVKGNKAERETLCGILGVCDILQHPDHPGFLSQYPVVTDREMPNQHFIDLEWPFCWYNSDHGVNLAAFDKIKSTGANKLLERTRLRRATQR
jgi:hypothetical protein